MVPSLKPVEYGSGISADEDEEHWEIERIVGKRMDKRRCVGDRIQYLVRWKGFTVKNDEWRSARDLKYC